MVAPNRLAPRIKSSLAQARGKRLRERFGIQEGSPLQSRELRNALEHFDERLDDFLVDNHFGCFFPSPMVDDASLSEETMGHIFRLVDPKTSNSFSWERLTRSKNCVKSPRP